jgi:hypothetical protein
MLYPLVDPLDWSTVQTYEAAGARFAFDRKTVAELMALVEDQLELPEQLPRLEK